MAKVVIGVDPHKGMNAVVVVNSKGKVLGHTLRAGAHLRGRPGGRFDLPLQLGEAPVNGDQADELVGGQLTAETASSSRTSDWKWVREGKRGRLFNPA